MLTALWVAISRPVVASLGVVCAEARVLSFSNAEYADDAWAQSMVSQVGLAWLPVVGIRMRDTIPPQSLHRLKDHPDVCSKTRMASAAETVIANLDEILETTRHAVHRRTRVQGFQLSAAGARLSPEQLGVSKARPGEIRPSEETFLEFAVLEAYRERRSGSDMPWDVLIGRQIPLMAKKSSEGWGSIDLMGLDSAGRPVVIELKKASSTETPLRALLEAAAYAVSVESNWTVLSDEIHRTGPKNHPAESPRPIGVVVAAPDRYWRNWDRWSATGRGVPAGTRECIQDVAQALAQAGIPSTFVELTYGDWTGTKPLAGTAVSSTLIEPWA